MPDVDAGDIAVPVPARGILSPRFFDYASATEQKLDVTTCTDDLLPLIVMASFLPLRW